jgi:hypothetical protein
MTTVAVVALLIVAVVLALVDASATVPAAGPVRASPVTVTALPAPASAEANVADAAEESQVTPDTAGLSVQEVIVAEVVPS